MICRVCGQTLGESINGMEAHMRRYHNVATLQKPKHTPKPQVVARWEANHPEVFIGLLAECPDGCKCTRCFQQALDRLVATSEAAANDSGTGIDQHDELASDELPERPISNGQYTIQHGYGFENE